MENGGMAQKGWRGNLHSANDKIIFGDFDWNMEE